MKHLFKALAAFQQEVPVIHKGTQGYGYSYADLPTIFEKINPLLKKHGLGFSQLLDGLKIKTIVFHCESGESIESVCDIPQGISLKGMNEFQVAGSAITYFRRYSLSAILGIVTDKDTDAAGEQSKPDTMRQNDIIKHLGNITKVEDLSVLWDSLEEKEQAQFKALFSKKKKTLTGE